MVRNSLILNDLCEDPYKCLGLGVAYTQCLYHDCWVIYGRVG